MAILKGAIGCILRVLNINWLNILWRPSWCPILIRRSMPPHGKNVVFLKHSRAWKLMSCPLWKLLAGVCSKSHNNDLRCECKLEHHPESSRRLVDQFGGPFLRRHTCMCSCMKPGLLKSISCACLQDSRFHGILDMSFGRPFFSTSHIACVHAWNRNCWSRSHKYGG